MILVVSSNLVILILLLILTLPFPPQWLQHPARRGTQRVGGEGKLLCARAGLAVELQDPEELAVPQQGRAVSSAQLHPENQKFPPVVAHPALSHVLTGETSPH